MAKIPTFDLPAIEALLEVIDDGIWFWNAETASVYRNPSWYKMLGYAPHSLEGTVLTWEKIIHPDDFNRVMEHFENYINGKADSYEVEYRCQTQSNGYLWIRDKALLIEKAADGSVKRMLGAHHDIDAVKHLTELNSIQKKDFDNIIKARTKELEKLNSQLERKAREAEKLAATDHLTGLDNRLSFDKNIKAEMARAIRFKEPLSLIILDIDNFKHINDNEGHVIGDQMLTEVAQVLTKNLREIDHASRWGGDEFAILLPNTTSDDAFLVAEKIRKSIAVIPYEQLSVSISASFGITQLAITDSQNDFLRKADNALYDSKLGGKNKVTAKSA